MFQDDSKLLPAKPVLVFGLEQATATATKRLESAHFGDFGRLGGAHFVTCFAGIQHKRDQQRIFQNFLRFVFFGFLVFFRPPDVVQR